jgi:hypothetical protein
MLLKHGLYLKLMSGGKVCLKERCFNVFLERNKRTEHGEKVTTMNYMKHLTNQTLLIAPKLKDWHGQDTWCV